MMFILTAMVLIAMQFFLAGIMMNLIIGAIVEKDGWKVIVRDISLFLLFFVPGIINVLEVVVTW